jgi:hypothetical protein
MIPIGICARLHELNTGVLHSPSVHVPLAVLKELHQLEKINDWCINLQKVKEKSRGSIE